MLDGIIMLRKIEVEPRFHGDLRAPRNITANATYQIQAAPSPMTT